MTWLTESKRIRLVYSSNKKLIPNFIKLILGNFDSTKQIIVVDPKHYWSSKTLTQKSMVFRPVSLNTFLTCLQNLELYISPRLDLIIVNDFPYYFRDYKGKSAKEVVINTRAYSVSLLLLNRIAKLTIPILITSYANAFNTNLPIFENSSLYYSCDFVNISLHNSNKYLMKVNDEILQLNLNNLNLNRI